MYSLYIIDLHTAAAYGVYVQCIVYISSIYIQLQQMAYICSMCSVYSIDLHIAAADGIYVQCVVYISSNYIQLQLMAYMFNV